MMRAEEKELMTAIKAAAWDEVGEQMEALRQALLNGEASKADTNWNAPPSTLGVLGHLA